MNNLTATQRNRLLGLALGAFGFVALVWYVLILPQRARLEAKQQKLVDVQREMTAAKRNLGLLNEFENDLKLSKHVLQQREQQMASADVYRWMVRIFDELASAHSISVFNLEAPRVEESTIPPKVPYKAAVFSVSGTAYYHEFGKFLADLENKFPHIRLQGLELKAALTGDADAEEREKLTFKMDLLTLVQPAPKREE